MPRDVSTRTSTDAQKALSGSLTTKSSLRPTRNWNKTPAAGAQNYALQKRYNMADKKDIELTFEQQETPKFEEENKERLSLEEKAEKADQRP